MEIAVIKGKIMIDSTLGKELRSIIESKHLQKVKENYIKFQKNKGYYLLVKGEKSGMPYHVFQYYVKLDPETYLLFKTDIYGNENVDSRLCKSFLIMNSLKMNRALKSK